jgi:hypothetical protein
MFINDTSLATGFVNTGKLLLVLIWLCAYQEYSFSQENMTRETFPGGELFEPLVADPKEPQFSTGFRRVDSSGQLGEFTAGIVSYGEHFGLTRWEALSGRQWQLSIVGALFAQFNMNAESKDLINADYTIGLSGNYRYRSMSYRLRIFHQSSHLGDELLLGPTAPERINLSLEAIDFMAAYEARGIRVYGGGIYLVNVEPSSLDRRGLQFGIDLIKDRYPLLQGRLVAGMDFGAFEGNDWNLNNTIKVGLEYGKPGSGNRRMRVMLERYDGIAPFGQFYDVDIKSYGVSLYLLY